MTKSNLQKKIEGNEEDTRNKEENNDKLENDKPEELEEAEDDLNP